MTGPVAFARSCPASEVLTMTGTGAGVSGVSWTQDRGSLDEIGGKGLVWVQRVKALDWLREALGQGTEWRRGSSKRGAGGR